MNIANPHQRRHVRLMRLGGQGVTEEDGRLDLSLGHTTTNDEIATFGTVNNSFNVQTEFVGQQLPGVAGRHESLFAEEVDVAPHELNEISFLFVVGDGDGSWSSPSPSECVHVVCRAGRP